MKLKKVKEQITIGITEFLALEPFRLEYISSLSVGAAVHDESCLLLRLITIGPNPVTFVSVSNSCCL
jgi:hypothetical protein